MPDEKEVKESEEAAFVVENDLIKSKYKVWLPKDTTGSRRLKLANGARFNANKWEELELAEDDVRREEVKNQVDFPEKVLELTEFEVEQLRDRGFKATKLAEQNQKAPEVKTVQEKLEKLEKVQEKAVKVTDSKKEQEKGK